MLSAGRERPVRGAHLERVDLVRSEHGREVGEQRTLRLGDALAASDPHPLGDVDDGLGAELVDQLRVHRVHRVDRGLLQREAAVAARLGVRDVPDLAVVERDLDRGRRGEHRARRDAVLERGHQRERLERRARLSPGAASRREVHAAVAGVRVPVVGVVPADHRADVAGAGIDHGHRARRVARVREHRSHRALREPLELGIDRGRDAEAAGEQELVSVLARLAERRVREEPLLEVVDEVGVRIAITGRERVELDRLGDGLVLLGRRDHPLVEHLPEHVVAPDPRVHRVRERVEVVRRADQPGEQRGLGEREVLRVDVEVRARRRLDAVRPLSEVHRVQVLREDLVLGEPILELPGEHRLVDLPLERLVVAHVQLLHELLRDGGAAFDDPSCGDVRVRGTDDRAQVEPVVVVEALVLDGDDRVADRLRHLRSGEHHPVHAGVELGDEAPVGRVEERGLGERDRPLTVVGQLWETAAR